MKKIGIIGASYLQLPLILKAKEMGLETHVFAWQVGDRGETEADFFYPISIIEKEQILAKCREIGIDGICSIASDLAMHTVNYIAHQMGLVANSLETTEVSTNKHLMRRRFEACGDPSPRSMRVASVDELAGVELEYPLIVKPLDRSGSRGITKVTRYEQLAPAIEFAKSQGFEKHALVEEYADGQEYSVEYISWKGEHHFLAMTKKFTTGAPHFIETGHIEPAPVDALMLERVKGVVAHALDSLGIRFGASHTELKINEKGVIRIIEIGGRMGGDCIGSALVRLSTGIDFVKGVIEVALGKEPADLTPKYCRAAAVRFIFSQEDVDVFRCVQKDHPELLVDYEVHPVEDREVSDSSTRFGYFLLNAETSAELEPFLPENL